MLNISTSVNPAATLPAYAYFPLYLRRDTDELLPEIPGWKAVQPGQYQADGDYGVSLKADDFVIDADPRNYPEGRDVLAELMQKFTLPQTRVVQTPRGGYHIYLKKPAATKIKVKQSDWPGIDFLSEDHYVAGPGSAKQAGPYKAVYDIAAAQAPVALLGALEAPPEANKQGGEFSLDQMQAFIIECKSAEPPMSGNRSNALFKQACRGKDLGLPREICYDVVAEHYNSRSDAPFKEIDLRQTVDNAYKHGKNAVGCETPQAMFQAFAGEAKNVVSIAKHQEELVVSGLIPEALLADDKGQYKPVLANVAYVLVHDSAWRGKLKHNEFSKQIEWRERPAWRSEQLNEGLEVDNRDTACLGVWFSSALHVRWEVSDDKLWRALAAAATPYHPVRDYLDSLVWDGEKRLERILIDTAGAPENPYTRAVGKATLIGAVNRIYEPGCKMDYVLVLVGSQGKKKSTWVATLGGDWYSANELNRGDKDSWQNLRGRWFVELPEINSTFSKHDFNWLKAVITNATDVYRPSYGKASKAVPRESVFIGTINPSVTGEFLKDEENRRYWPVEVNDIDIARLARDRDQYFAEAVHCYRQGEKPFIVDPEVEAMARAEQERRREKDPWVHLLQGWGEGQLDGFSLTSAYAAIGIVGASASSYQRQRLYAALNEAGFNFDHVDKKWRKA